MSKELENEALKKRAINFQSSKNCQSIPIGQPNGKKWQVILHEQVENPYFEITNGPISICANAGEVGETEDQEEAIFMALVEQLNKSGIDFHSENKLELQQHLKIMELENNFSYYKAYVDSKLSQIKYLTVNDQPAIINARQIFNIANETIEFKKNQSPGFIPVVVTQDNEGHWYVIPAEMENDFSRLLDDSGTDEDAEQMFIETFSSYLTGGDLNLIQLYMKVEEKPAIELKEGKVFVFGDAAPIQRGSDIYEHGIAGPASGKCPPLNSVEHEYHATFTLKQPGALEMVEEFHKAFGVPVYKSPIIPSGQRKVLRTELIYEELKELKIAMGMQDMVGILDALCDLLYVVYGTAHEFGLGPVLKEAFAEVHRSNMSKLNGDGTPIIRNDGKVLKGPSYTPPDLASILKRFAEGQTTEKINQMLQDNTVKYHDSNTYPQFDPNGYWLGVLNDAIPYLELLEADNIHDPSVGLRRDVKLTEVLQNAKAIIGISPSLGVNLPEITGMPDPIKDGIILSDLKKVTNAEEPPKDNREYGRDADQTYPNK